MKNLLIILAFISLQSVHAQTVMSSAGVINASNGAVVSYTIGETIVQNVVSNKNVVTYGYQQPKAKIVLADSDNHEIIDFGIYPNPTTAQVYIKNTSNIRKIEVINDLGQTLLVKNQDFESINFTDFANGIYFLKINTLENKLAVQKIIKQ